jgi:hypothetical protein
MEREQDSRLARVKEGVVAGASNVADNVSEFTRDIVDATRDKARQAARIVREAEPDAELRERAQKSTEGGLDRAGQAVAGAAPAIGRGAEYAATRLGDALKFVARPAGVIIGTLAGTVGGWWNKASELKQHMPEEEERACRIHFATFAGSGLTFDQARSGYILGYVAGCNPGYQGRAFDDVEPDLRQGFAADDTEYDVLREFARYGYSRGSGSRGSGSPGSLAAPPV